jgi:hypothetical protein
MKFTLRKDKFMNAQEIGDLVSAVVALVIALTAYLKSRAAVKQVKQLTVTMTDRENKS